MRHAALPALALIASQSAVAQTAPAPPPPPAEVTAKDDIIVTAQVQRGAVVSDIPPVLELDEQAVASYGASSIAELLGALSPQTGGGGGRGGGRGGSQTFTIGGNGGGPVVLLNGQRISGFAEIRDLPPEAIQRVQVLPEEVALQYGFAPDQRVVNFILKENYAAVTGELEGGAATAGHRKAGEVSASAVRIRRLGRLQLSGNYTRASRTLESDRGIVATSAANDPAFRTLLPATETASLNGTLNRKLTDAVALTVNTSIVTERNDALLGLPLTLITVDPLDRATRSSVLHGGMTLIGGAPSLRWAFTANYDRGITRTSTDRANGATDYARSQSDAANAIYTLSPKVAELPAGRLQTSLRLGFAFTRLNSNAIRSGANTITRLARDSANGQLTVGVPIANASRGVLSFLGRLSFDGSLAYEQLSDFGRLISYTYGLNWQPGEGLTLLATAIGNENEPGIGELGNPAIVTPSVATYDFTTGQTVLATRINGGNPLLVTEVQRDAKFSAQYEPKWLTGLNIEANYFRNRSRNPVAGFPVLTPEIEAAFPDRVVRAGGGRLVSVDARSINFAQTRSDVVRVGFTFQKQFGQPAGEGRSGGRRRGEGGGGRGGGGRGGRSGGGFGGGGFGRPGQEGGRWSVSLYDSIRFKDEILIRPGLPVLDLLAGSATGGNGGAARHSFDLDAGWFNKGIGFRIAGAYTSGSTVIGGTGASTLRFGDLATLNATMFANFDSRPKLVEAVPFLKGARLRLSVQNLTNDIRDVRDGSGAVPLSFQPGYLDARGRYVELSFRKRF